MEELVRKYTRTVDEFLRDVRKSHPTLGLSYTKEFQEELRWLGNQLKSSIAPEEMVREQVQKWFSVWQIRIKACEDIEKMSKVG